MIHFDERGMAFHALGIAKATKRPAAIVVTSGTAVGNIFPAVMEAAYAHIPLILLTSDRPFELRDTSANQTADHIKIFGDNVRWHFDLPPPESSLSDDFLSSTLSHAVFRAMHPPKGAVHINCMFREPFFSTRTVELEPLEPTYYERTEATLPTSAIERWAEKLSTHKKGLILVGAMQSERELSSIIELGNKLKWPIVADIISGMRSEGEQESLIGHWDLILKTAGIDKPDAILHLGDRFVSKTLFDYLAAASPQFYCMVADHPVRCDPKHLLTHRIACDPALFCEQLLKVIPESNSSIWFETWKEHSAKIKEQLDTLFATDTNLTEPGVVRTLSSCLSKEWALFLSNSMPIRDADNFLFPKGSIGPIFSNRGLSGIDGNIATAIGLSVGCNLPLIALLGDLAALHDINSLAQVHKTNKPVVFLIFNNRGGGIFSFLPVREKKHAFEEFFAANHSYTFDQAAALFHLPYYGIKTLDEWQEHLPKILENKSSCVVEITTNREENFLFHEQIKKVLKEKQCFPTSAEVL